MPTYVKTDYVPEWNGYITIGKEYHLVYDCLSGGEIYGDDGRKEYIHFEASAHLDNRAWTVINRP